MGTSLLLESTTTMMLNVACHFAGDALCSCPMRPPSSISTKADANQSVNVLSYRCCIFKEAWYVVSKQVNYVKEIVFTETEDRLLLDGDHGLIKTAKGER